MLSVSLKFIAVTALMVALATVAVIESSAHTLVDGAIVISNRAEATYQDDTGESFSTASETVTISVVAISAVSVTPDDQSPSGSLLPHNHATRLFRVCNAGNSPDTFIITKFDVTSPVALEALFFDNDGDGKITDGDTPINLNDTSSPQLPAGGCIGVLSALNTNDVAVQSTITLRLTARSTNASAANGHSEDTGTIINEVAEGARFTDPADSNLPPSKRVNGLNQFVAEANSPFTYQIAFRNSAAADAHNVIVSDQLPSAIEYIPGSLELNDRSLTDAIDADEGSVQGQKIEVRLAQLRAGEVVRLSFNARLSSTAGTGTGVVNKAVVEADNAASIQTSPATVVSNPFGVVFAGRAGGSTPISGARLEVSQDQAGANLVSLPPNVGFSPNQSNQNPFSSDSQGHFTFALGNDEIGSSSTNYFLRISAPGYVSRLLQVTVRPTQLGLFALTVHALDSQPLAIASGFDLTREDVSMNDLAVLAMNIPLFETANLEIMKSVDRARAQIGDTVTYRIEVHNPTSAAISNLTIEDHLPPSFNYAAGSALTGSSNTADQTVEPEIDGSVLRFHLAELAHGGSVHVLYRVRIGVNAQSGDQDNIANAAGVFSSGERVQTPAARATVFVSTGVFSTQQVLIGRVFVDVNGNGSFDYGDRPAPGVRLYLSNGQSVITDSAGLYNFPSLSDGPQVISLDPVSVPAGYALSDGGRLSGRSWTRLLRTPIGGGALLRQNFALRPISHSGAGLSMKPSKTTDVSVNELQSKFSADVPKPEGASSLDSTTAMTSPSAPGTYEVAAPEAVNAVAPGDIQILSPLPDSVSMSPGLQVEARVALNWTVRLEVNGEQISDKSIGVRSLDHKNQVSTFTFVGINLKPGPNRIRCVPISPEGIAGHSQDLSVMGRGPVRRLELSTDKNEIQTGGNDFTIVRVKAFDQWDHPALDGEIGVETSLGELQRLNKASVAATKSTSKLPESVGAANTQLVIQLESGEASLKLLGSGAPGDAHLHAQTGQIEVRYDVHVSSEMRPNLLVGLAEMSFGKGIPEVGLRNEQGSYRGRINFFYSGKLPGDSMLTMSYDSQRPINRTAGANRMFQLDPLDRAYPLFGDSSTRYEAAQSNSRLYLRIDHKRSYAMFGDFETDAEAPLAGYSRKLTGVKAHLENSQGDFITVTGARPDTAFARDVFPAGSLSLIQLSNAEILPGSEIVTLEVRDRRNPEIILSRETLARSIDYNLDPLSGSLLLLRYISAFDSVLNLTQIVVTYEHRANSLNSAVYTARARKHLARLGLKLGFSAALQRQADQGNFVLGGVDIEKSLPRGGSLQLAWARSEGQILGGGNILSTNENGQHNGDAYQLVLTEPLPFYSAVIRAKYLNASAEFLNPFGGTVTPGSRRGEVSLEMKPLKNSIFHFAAISERNQTANVNDGRTTFSVALDQILNDRVKLHLGFDHRAFTDDLNDKTTDSNLVTAGAEVQATDKLQFSIKREQNLSDADPTYPTQTTLGASYQVNSVTRIFFTQRLASAPIMPIGDFTANGFAVSSSRRETALGIETRFGKSTLLTSRYQLENGINGTDSFAVIGLQERLPLNKKFSLDFGVERGFHLLGPNDSFNSGTFGLGWEPNSDFRAAAKYEYRDRGGVGQLFSINAAGRISEGVTALSRLQFSRGSFNGNASESIEGTASLAIRPLRSDRSGLLFTYTHRSLDQNSAGTTPTRDRIDSVSSDGYQQLGERLEVYGRFALSFSANGQPQQPFVSTLSFLTQARAQYLLTNRLDWALETRLLFQPSSATRRAVYATEAGFWVLPDVRFGIGYNLTDAHEPGSILLPAHRGFYFTISSKLSNLFDLFGTSKAGLNTSSTESKEANQQ